MLVSLQDRTSDLTPFPEPHLSESGGKKDCWSQPDPDRNCGFSQALPRLCFADFCVVSCSEWVGQWALQPSRMFPGCCRDAWFKVHPVDGRVCMVPTEFTKQENTEHLFSAPGCSSSPALSSLTLPDLIETRPRMKNTFNNTRSQGVWACSTYL